MRRSSGLAAAAAGRAAAAAAAAAAARRVTTQGGGVPAVAHVVAAAAARPQRCAAAAPSSSSMSTLPMASAGVPPASSAPSASLSSSPSCCFSSLLRARGLMALAAARPSSGVVSSPPRTGVRRERLARAAALDAGAGSVGAAADDSTDSVGSVGSSSASSSASSSSSSSSSSDSSSSSSSAAVGAASGASSKRHLIVGLDVNTKSTGIAVIDAATGAVVDAQVVLTDNLVAPTVYEKAVLVRRALESLRESLPVRLGESPRDVVWTTGVEEFLLMIFHSSSAHALFKLAQVNTLASYDVMALFGHAPFRVFAQTARAHFDLKLAAPRRPRRSKKAMAEAAAAAEARKAAAAARGEEVVEEEEDTSWKAQALVKAQEQLKEVSSRTAADSGLSATQEHFLDSFSPPNTDSKTLQKHAVWRFAAPFFPEGFDWPTVRAAPTRRGSATTAVVEELDDEEQSGAGAAAARGEGPGATAPASTASGFRDVDLDAGADMVAHEGEDDDDDDDDFLASRRPRRIRLDAYDMTDAFLVAMYVRSFHVHREGRVKWPSDPAEHDAFVGTMTNANLAAELRAIGIAASGKKADLERKLRRALANGSVPLGHLQHEGGDELQQ